MLFSFLAYGYLLGYVQRKWREKDRAEGKGRLKWLAVPVCVVGIVLIQAATGNVQSCTTGTAVRLLRSGEARAYEQEYQERYRQLTDTSMQELVFQPYQHQPEMLYVGDFSSDPEEPTNVKVAEFFEKTSVRVDYE